MNLDKIIRSIRNSEKLFSDDATIADKASRILGKALEQRKTLREVLPPKVGPYSGLTRRELNSTGTCETDWY